MDNPLKPKKDETSNDDSGILDSDIVATDEEGNPLSKKAGKIKSNSEEEGDVVSLEEGDDSIQKLRERLKVCVEEKQKYLDGWQRDKADFINSKKRADEMHKEFVQFSNLNLISELIPVLDSFNMAMGNKEVWEKADKNWRVGVEYIASQFKKILGDNGLKEIDPIGEKFDPMRDEAIEYIKVEEEKKDQVVVSVIQKGYSMNGKVLKAPKVKVGEFSKGA